MNLGGMANWLFFRHLKRFCFVKWGRANSERFEGKPQNSAPNILTVGATLEEACLKLRANFF
jgi:hypothetical protein